MILKVLSWNIWFGKHYHEIVKHLKDAEADIIALQEVIQDLDGKHNTAENIAKELGYHWKYEETLRLDYEGKMISWGNAILSKHKIVETKLHELSSGDQRRTALEAKIEIEGKEVTIFSTHLVHTHQKPSDLQESQAKNLMEIVPNENALVMGDFNALPDSNAVRYVSERLQNTDTQLDPSWSVYIDGCDVCQVDQLIHRLDYIFTTKGIKVHSFQTDYSKGSDHLPIAASIEM
jgi:endonuclease/exonuclease/phosphatase family metal-dependent hydrolase